MITFILWFLQYFPYLNEAKDKGNTQEKHKTHWTRNLRRILLSDAYWVSNRERERDRDREFRDI